MALLTALCLFLTLPAGFRNAQLRQHVAALLGRDLADYRPAQMTYDLRRLRRKGFICRQAGSTRYELTPCGPYTSLFLVWLYQRVLRPGLAAAVEPHRVDAHEGSICADVWTVPHFVRIGTHESGGHGHVPLALK